MPYRRGSEPDVYDLCVIGAGIAGLNSLYVAKQYLPESAQVLLIDRNHRPGGVWNTAYDYVRLHQPYEMFTVGNLPWQISKPRGYLATGSEVLSHLRFCLARIERDCQIRKLWSTEVVELDELITGSGATALIRTRDVSGSISSREYQARRVIFAKGLDVPVLDPLHFSSVNVESCTPQTLSSYMHKNAPVYIVGGGKTGMDTALALGRQGDQTKVSMFVGNGTVFNNRDLLFPTGIKRYVNQSSNMKMAIDLSMKYNGSNTEDVFEHFKTKYSISPGNSGDRFIFGLVSEAECTQIEALTHQIVHEFVEDVVDAEAGPEIVFRSGERKPVEPGAVFVNCTGHLLLSNVARDTPLSACGTIMTISSTCSFSFLPAVASYFMSHLLFSNKLQFEPFYFIDVDALFRKDQKAAFLASLTQALLNPLLAFEALPLRVFQNSGLDFDLWHPFYKRAVDFVGKQINRAKYIDHCHQTLDTVARQYDVSCGPL
ncbi:MAG: FAD-dependent oxidoreductase [Pseudomonadota bacterium]